MILNVLGKSSTAKHVEELHAPTDGQNGKVTCQCIAQQPCLSLVTFLIGLVGLRQPSLPVQGGIQVGAAGKYQSTQIIKRFWILHRTDINRIQCLSIWLTPSLGRLSTE
jgi:hypothetical protein